MEEHTNPFSLNDKVAFVTGSASGIGRAAAVALARAGAVVACADIVDPTETVDLIREFGGEGWGAEVDVRSGDRVDSFVHEIVDRTGRLDAAVNNAGVLVRASALEVAPQLVSNVFEVNVIGVLHGSQAAARAMMPRRSGAIVNIASTSIDSSLAGNLVYSSSKASVRQMTRTMAREWGSWGIRVNAVAPGWLETELTRRADGAALAGEFDESAFESKRADVRAARVLSQDGSVDDIAHAVQFLTSDASRWITGQALRVDGGVAMPW